MSATGNIPFLKMNGLGNDFIIVDGRSTPRAFSHEQVRAWSDRATGIGCDQFIVMEKSGVADVRMRIYNAEAREVESCGNASRCVASLLFAETGADTATIDTKGGFLACRKAEDGLVTVDMGQPKFGWADIPLAEEFYETRGIELQIGPIDARILHTPSVGSVGNPHAVFWVDDVEAYDLGRLGPMLENHPIFPDRCNISLAQVISVRTMPWDVSTWVATRSSLIGSQKLGQPDPESNLVSDENSSFPQPAHTYRPFCLVLTYSPLNGGSVAPWRRT